MAAGTVARYHPSRLAEEARTSSDERNCAHAGMTTRMRQKKKARMKRALNDLPIDRS
jgi:hypothetical protein